MCNFPSGVRGISVKAEVRLSASVHTTREVKRGVKHKSIFQMSGIMFGGAGESTKLYQLMSKQNTETVPQLYRSDSFLDLSRDSTSALSTVSPIPVPYTFFMNAEAFLCTSERP